MKIKFIKPFSYVLNAYSFENLSKTNKEQWKMAFSDPGYWFLLICEFLIVGYVVSLLF